MKNKEKAIIEAYKTADYDTKVKLKQAFPDYFEIKAHTWYKTKQGAHVIKNSKGDFSGFNTLGNWFDLPNFEPDFEMLEENEDLQDVYSLLMKEGRKRGLVSDSNDDVDFNFTKIDYLRLNGRMIFEDGQWATTPNNINDLIDQLKEACEEEGFSVNVIIESENKL